jgi:hypothetical protein
MSRYPHPSTFRTTRIMNKSLTVALAFLLGGTASLVLAQPPKESFAETFARLQAESSNSAMFQQDKPDFNAAAAYPSTGLAFREAQALSSNSSMWQLDSGKVDFDYGPTFAKTHPHGLPFAVYEAYASNSGAFALPQDADASQDTATGVADVASGTPKLTLGERIARFLQRGRDQHY